MFVIYLNDGRKRRSIIEKLKKIMRRVLKIRPWAASPFVAVGLWIEKLMMYG